MKRILITGVSLFALMGAANAADIYNGSTKDRPVAIEPAATWTGFYAGVNAGGAWTQFDTSWTDSGTIGKTPWALTINHTNAADGFAGGGQLGYNWQTGAFLLGFESDIGYLGVQQDRKIVAASLGTYGVGVGTRIDSGLLVDVTGRIGWVSGPALFYAKGGWAYFDGTVGTSGISALAATLKAKGFADVSKSGLDGWTIGGGIEYLVSPSWSIKAEYQYFDFGSFDLQPITVSTTIPALNNNLGVNIAKVGLNYHLNSGYAPLK